MSDWKDTLVHVCSSTQTTVPHGFSHRWLDMQSQLLIHIYVSAPTSPLSPIVPSQLLINEVFI